MVVKTYHRGDKISPFRVKDAFFKQTSRDEKVKNMAASHWTDATCRTDFFPWKEKHVLHMAFLCWPAMFICQRLLSVVLELRNLLLTTTKTVPQRLEILQNWELSCGIILKCPEQELIVPCEIILNCYTCSWHKSSEFSQTGRFDPRNANLSPKK